MQILEQFILFAYFRKSPMKSPNIQVKEETKKSIRETIDMLYDEYVGLHLKSKKFIDQMKTGKYVKIPPRKKEKININKQTFF